MKNYQSGAHFNDTNWEFIENLKNIKLENLSDDTYDEFVAVYKDPLYSFLRYSGYTPQDSEDLIQDFFIKLLETDLLKEVSKEKGKLRSYLIGALKRVVNRKQRDAKAQKRGGGMRHEQIDGIAEDPETQDSPAIIYDQAWSKALISGVKKKLFEDQPQLTDVEKKTLLELLNWNAQEISYKEGSQIIGIGVAALKSRVFRLRAEFKELLYQEIAKTLSNPSIEEIENEIETLRNSWKN